MVGQKTEFAELRGHGDQRRRRDQADRQANLYDTTQLHFSAEAKVSDGNVSPKRTTRPA